MLCTDALSVGPGSDLQQSQSFDSSSGLEFSLSPTLQRQYHRLAAPILHRPKTSGLTGSQLPEILLQTRKPDLYLNSILALGLPQPSGHPAPSEHHISTPLPNACVRETTGPCYTTGLRAATRSFASQLPFRGRLQVSEPPPFCTREASPLAFAFAAQYHNLSGDRYLQLAVAPWPTLKYTIGKHPE